MISRERDIWVYTQKTQGKTYVKMEAEMMALQSKDAKECWQPPAA